MEKKQYMSPLVEVAKVNMCATVLTGSPVEDNTTPTPPPGPVGYSRRRTPVF